MSESLPPRNRYVTELRLPYEHVRYHVITYSGYRQVSSSNAFFYGTEKKDAMDRKRGIIWPSHLEHEHRHYTKKYHGVSIWEGGLPIILHDSIWDFYKFVGYDYKKKRWI